jgi:hypothetical protein
MYSSVRVIWRHGKPARLKARVISGGGQRLALFSSFSSAFTWLVVAILVLLIVSLRNTWDLLVTVGDFTLRG